MDGVNLSGLSLNLWRDREILLRRLKHVASDFAKSVFVQRKGDVVEWFELF